MNTSPETATLRKALEKAREEIVLAVAFLGRDLFTDRINDTADSLVTRLAKADADIRTVLSSDLAQTPAHTYRETVRKVAAAREKRMAQLRDCLQSIADMPTNEPREPDDADWRFRCLSAIEVAKNTLADTSTDRPANPADDIIGQIETRFPDWRGFRDLVDCIDVTLHRLRGGR